MLDAAVNPKMEWLREVLDMSRAMRPFVLLDPNATCVGNGHKNLHCGLQWFALSILRFRPAKVKVGHEVLNPRLPDDDFDAAVSIAQTELPTTHLTWPKRSQTSA
jgi:hypothetical protein